MTLEFREEPVGKILVISASGKLTRADYDRFLPETERLIRHYGKIRILFEMRDFHGWEAGALWQDINFDVKHFADIERLALVGEKTWEHAMAVFCRPFTTAKIRYFDISQAAEARAWIEESL